MKSNRSQRFSLRCCCILMTLVANCTFAATDTNSIKWVQLSPAVSPSPRSYMAMAYDPMTGKTTMFGGFDGSSYLNDTWIFDGTNWTQVTTPIAPPNMVVFPVM